MGLPNTPIDKQLQSRLNSLLEPHGIRTIVETPEETTRDLTTIGYVCRRDQDCVRLLVSSRDADDVAMVTFMVAEMGASAALASEIANLLADGPTKQNQAMNPSGNGE